MGRRNFLTYLLVSLCFLSLLPAGCGMEKEEEENGDAMSSVDLRGIWTGACLSVNDAYGRIVITFLSETFTYQSTRYSDAGCTKPTDVIKGRGTYALVAEETSKSSDEDKAKKAGGVDYKFEEIVWEFTSEPALAVDWASYCKGRLKSDGIVDVLGGNCSIGSDSLNFRAKQFGSFLIDNELLYITDLTTNGASVETRAVDVDLSEGAMLKQEIPADD